MIIWIVKTAFEYDGDTILCARSSLEKARKWAEENGYVSCAQAPPAPPPDSGSAAWVERVRYFEEVVNSDLGLEIVEVEVDTDRAEVVEGYSKLRSCA